MLILPVLFYIKMACKRVHKTLLLIDKKLIGEVGKGIRKEKDIAADFGIPANILLTIIKNKHLLLSSAEGGGLVSDMH
jgi:hypothetical protein